MRHPVTVAFVHKSTNLCMAATAMAGQSPVLKEFAAGTLTKPQVACIYIMPSAFKSIAIAMYTPDRVAWQATVTSPA